MTQLAVHDRVKRKLGRAWKFAARRATTLTAGSNGSPNAVFVLGSGRSGTRVPMVAFEQSPETITYREGHRRMFRGALLKNDEVVHDVLRTTPFKTVVMKPICESHRAVEFLERFPNAKVIWIFRDYRDAVNSAAKKWTSALRHVRSLATGQPHLASWRAGGLTAHKLALVSDLFSPDLSLVGAHGIMWYLRNGLFFDLQLQHRPDVLLVRYEDLVQQPKKFFPEVFSFAGTAFDPAFVTGIYDRSVQRDAPPDLAEPLEQLCADLHSRMLDYYRSRCPVAAI